MLFNALTFFTLAATTLVSAAPQIHKLGGAIDIRNRQGSNIIVVNEGDNFFGDNRQFGRWGGRDHGRFDDIFFDIINDRNRRNDINLNIVDLLLNGNDRNRFDVDRFGRFNNFNRFDDRLNQIVIIRLDEIHRVRNRDFDRQRRIFDFLDRRRRDFLQRRDNVDVVIVIANPVQNVFNGVFERPFFDYDYHLFHNVGATETQTQIFTDIVTLTVQQTIGPNGEQATAVPSAVVSNIATPTSVEAVPTGVVDQAPVETGVQEEVVEEAPAEEEVVEETPAEDGAVEETPVEEAPAEEEVQAATA